MQKILETKGYKRALILILLGVFVVLALPPVYIFPLAFIGLSGLFLFLDRATSKKEAFIIGWMFGIGFFGAGLYWLTNAFLVHPDKHGWLIPIAVPALAISVGLFNGFTSLFSYLAWSFGQKNGPVWIRILLFCAIWTVMEWVRSWIFTGFPWNLIGTIWGFSDEMMQPAAYVGAFGLSLLTMFACTFGAALPRFKAASLFMVLALPGLMFLSGYLRLMNAQNDVHDEITLRLVQPNIPQKTKWDKGLKLDHFNKHLELSLKAGPNGQLPTHTIWPETAVTYAANRYPNVLQAISSVAPQGGAILTGTPRMTDRGVEPFQVWNSMIVVNDKAHVIASYDKSHLVPFGEYIPLRAWNPIPKLTAGMVDFSAGSGQKTIKIDGLPPFSPLICYEIIFPNAVLDKKNRPQWLLNLTNDGWYGNSPGPYQHLISARMRSIEEGLPLVRVANTGVTTATDSYGRMQTAIPYGTEGFVDIALHKPLEKMPLSATYPNTVWVVLIIAISLLNTLHLQVRMKKKSTQS
ncbi:MAG: apolipoprotein N-acyltransferase [Methylocystaceae bacterium]|nr:apolipoprotein N-acyltransferase [Methylocystaceae bacterium]